MGEARKSKRARRNPTTRFRSGAAYIRSLAPADRAVYDWLVNGSNALGALGIFWPMGIGAFATVHGEIVRPDMPGLSRYRYQNVSAGWPDFTAPWPVAAVLILAAIALTIWMLRHRAVFKKAYAATVFAWAGVAAGITGTAVMYLGAPGWPVWQLWLGIPAFGVAAALLVYGRRVSRRRSGARSP
jgi:hypothetical protein